MAHAPKYAAAARRLPGEVVETLGRVPLAGRQQMHLLRFGNKLLLVCVSPTGVDTLGEITDPSEIDRVAALCAQTNPREPLKPSTRFSVREPVTNHGSTVWSRSQDVFTVNGAHGGKLRGGRRCLANCLGAARSRCRNCNLLQSWKRSCRTNSESNLPRVFDRSRSIQQRCQNRLGRAIGWCPRKMDQPGRTLLTLQMMLLMSVLSLAPAIMLMTTCFVRVLVVLEYCGRH